MNAPDFDREPWKHPAVWTGHLISMTHAYPDGEAISVASCECGWAACARSTVKGHVAQTTAIHDHWRGVIAGADAEAVPA